MEETQHSLRLLERLDQSIQQNPIEAAVAELDAILVMFEKGVHGTSRVVRYLEHTPVDALLGARLDCACGKCSFSKCGSRSSHTGFQYWPVASRTTSRTWCCGGSQLTR
jgi:hypothetical protein